MAGITLINSFRVPAGREDEFFSRWRQVNTYMQSKPGYLEHTLYRSLMPDATYRFVNVARWESLESFNAAHDEGFRALVTDADWSAFPPNPVLYEVVHQGERQPTAA